MSFVGTGASFWLGIVNIPSSQAKPISLFGWYKRPNANSGQGGGIFGLGTSYYQPAATLTICPNTLNTSLILEDVTTTSSIFVSGDSVISAGPTWYPFGAVVSGLSSRTVYNPDGTSTTNTTAQSACVYDQLTLAAITRSGTTASPLMLGHQIAECAMWFGALGQGEMKSLLSGENPLNIQREDLAYYFPLVDSPQCFGNIDIDMPPFGGIRPQWGDHPNVSQIQSPRRYYYVGPRISFGSLIETQDPMTIASTASLVVNGSFAQTLNAMTLIGSISQGIVGQLTSTQQDFSLNGSAKGPVLGALNTTLASNTLNGNSGLGGAAYLMLNMAPQTLVGAGSVQGTKAALTENLASNTLSAHATNLVGAALTQNLSSMTFAGVMAAPVAGVLSQTMVPWQFNGVAKVLDVEGGVSLFLQSNTIAATSNVIVAGALHHQLSPNLPTLAGRVTVDGSLVATMASEADRLVADATQPAAVLSESMEAMTLSAIAVDPVVAKLTSPMDPMTSVINGSVTGYVANLNRTMAAFTLNSHAGPVTKGNLIQKMTSMLSATAQVGPVVPSPTYTYYATPPAPNWWPSKLHGTTRSYGLNISAHLKNGDKVNAISASIAPGGEMIPVAMHYADGLIVLMVTQGLPTRVYTVKFIVTTTTPDIFEILVHQDVPKELNWNLDAVPVNPDFGNDIQWSGEPPPLGFVPPYYFFA